MIYKCFLTLLILILVASCSSSKQTSDSTALDRLENIITDDEDFNAVPEEPLVETAPSEPGETKYRTILVEYSTTLKDYPALKDLGTVRVSPEQSGSIYKAVIIGEMNDAEATAVVNQLHRRGYPTARVEKQ